MCPDVCVLCTDHTSAPLSWVSAFPERTFKPLPPPPYPTPLAFRVPLGTSDTINARVWRRLFLFLSAGYTQRSSSFWESVLLLRKVGLGAVGAIALQGLFAALVVCVVVDGLPVVFGLLRLHCVFCVLYGWGLLCCCFLLRQLLLAVTITVLSGSPLQRYAALWILLAALAALVSVRPYSDKLHQRVEQAFLCASVATLLLAELFVANGVASAGWRVFAAVVRALHETWACVCCCPHPPFLSRAGVLLPPPSIPFTCRCAVAPTLHSFHVPVCCCIP